MLRVTIAAALVIACAGGHAGESELRVCADPDNLPYSHANGSGFENRIATIVASDLGVKLSYTWFPQRRGFVRRTLNERLCDVLIGVPTAFHLVRTTNPYYRSVYTFVYPAVSSHSYGNFDDPALTTARIGVQLVGDDLAATPPARVLALRGIVDHVVGYPVYGEAPQAERMVDALAKGDIDVALIWGPQAAYYARRAELPLRVVPAKAPADLAMLPFEFSISMGVRKNDVALAAPVLVLRAPRGVHHLRARHRDDLSDHRNVCLAPGVRVSGDRFCEYRDRFPELWRLGPSHVRDEHSRHQQELFHCREHDGRHTDRGSDLLLARYAVDGAPQPAHAVPVRACVLLHTRSGWSHGYHACGRPARSSGA